MQKICPDLDIGNNIRNLRLSHKLTQDAVVAKMQLMGLQSVDYTIKRIELRFNRLPRIKAISS